MFRAHLSYSSTWETCLAALLVIACGTEPSAEHDAVTSSGGSKAGTPGGASATLAGGSSARVTSSGMGSATSTAGSIGGKASTGGTVGATLATGGAMQTGGGTAGVSGNATSTARATGGVTATGGVANAAGSTAKATGGIANAGGSTAKASGGVANAAGSTAKATGGSSATGGVTTGIGGAAGASGATSTGGPRWVGRVDASDPAAVKFAWQGAGFVASVSGSSIAVKLKTENTSSNTSAVFFQPVIDGKVGTRFKVDAGTDQTVTLATGLAAGNHTVELYRDTEGTYGLSTFLGFTSGTVQGAPTPSGRLIEVVGDSISAGYGNLGSEPHPNWVASPACHWTAENSTWYLSYAAVAGRALNAEVSTIARSGWGMYRDAEGNTSNVLSSVYAHALGTDLAQGWTFSAQPAVVVINLGTNDWAKGDPGASYEKVYVDFITQLRTHYPDAWIFLTIGSMLGDPELSQAKTRLSNVVSAVSGDKKLVSFDFGTQDLGADGSVPTGCDWHPSVKEHERMAGILQTQLKSKLGW